MCNFHRKRVLCDKFTKDSGGTVVAGGQWCVVTAAHKIGLDKPMQQFIKSLNQSHPSQDLILLSESSEKHLKQFLGLFQSLF